VADTDSSALLPANANYRPKLVTMAMHSHRTWRHRRQPTELRDLSHSRPATGSEIYEDTGRLHLHAVVGRMDGRNRRQYRFRAGGRQSAEEG